jgi:molybdate transport system substrate-binding protein
VINEQFECVGKNCQIGPERKQPRCAAFLALQLCICLILFGAADHGTAQDLRILGAGATQSALDEVIRIFEGSSGTHILVQYAPMGVVMERLNHGEKVDLVVVTQDVLEQASERHFILGPSAISLGRVGIGLAVRTDAPIPDISSPHALRKTLLEAKSITYIDPKKGTSGKQVAEILNQMGIAQEVQAKTTLGESGYVVVPVARGEIEIGIQQITEIMAVEGVRLVGPLPAPYQKITTYMIALTPSSFSNPMAKDFITELQSERSRAIFKRKGFDLSIGESSTSQH